MIFVRPFSYVGISALVLLVGCSSGTAPITASDASAITGNWQVSSTAPAAAKLPALSGQLTGSTSSITGIFHSSSASTCVASATPIKLTGGAGAKELVTLTGDVAGGVLTISGTLSTDGRTLSDASYKVTGGACAFSAAAAATAQSYSPVNGTYVGSFTDPDGNITSITAMLSQSPTSNSDGNFLLSGTSSQPGNVCFPSPISISNAQVTGGSFTLTYTDPNVNNSVTATGNFSTDATTLTVTSWVLSGPCGTDTGTGSLTRQP